MATPTPVPKTRQSSLSLVSRALGLAVAAAFVALLAYGLMAQAPDTSIDDNLVRGEAIEAPAFEPDVL